MRQSRLAMIVGLALLSGCVSDEKPTSAEGSNAVDQPARIQEVLIALEPYIQLNDDRTLSLKPSAEKELSTELLEIARGIVDLDNAIVDGRASKLASVQVHDTFKWMWPFFESIKDPCPRRVDSPLTFKSQKDVQDYLKKQGYHQTDGYAGGSDRDYSLPIFNRGVPAQKGKVPALLADYAYRTQALIFPKNSSWRFNTQTPEPSPEVFRYIPPAKWWAIYVHWWHLNYC